MNQEEVKAMDEAQRLRVKQDQDARVTMLLGMSTVVMTVLTALIMTTWLSGLSYGVCAIIVVLSLLASVIFWFKAGEDDRWRVMCTLINHIGIGVGLYLLLRVFALPGSAKDLGLGLLPGLALLGLFCLAFSRSGGSTRIYASVGGVAALVILTIVGAVLASRQSSAFYTTLAVCAAVCAGSYGALIWTSMEPGRSIHRTMALVSFAIYLILLAIAIVAIMFQASSGDSDRKSSRSSGKRSSAGSSLAGGTGYRRRGFGFFYPLYFSSYRGRGAYADERGDTYAGGRMVDPERTERMKRRAGLFLKWVVVILLVVFLTVLLIAIL